MIILGLTGSIGMGKSETTKAFAREGVPTFDSDAEVHRLFIQDADLKEAIRAQFPAAVKNNKIDRGVLGKEVFGSKDKIAKLEAIVHPMVQAAQQKFLKEQASKNSPLVVIDIPLLFETGGDKRVDKTLVVSAPKEVQQERVLAREGMSVERFEKIINQQMPDEEKQKKADYVIKTDSGIEAMQKDVRALIKQLLA